MVPLEHNLVSILYALKETVRSYFGQLEEDSFKNQEERLKHVEAILKKLEFQSEKALQIVKRIATTSERTPSKASLQAVLIQEAWQKVVTILKNEFDLSAIDLVERIPERFPTIQCEPEEFQEILYNLTKNALQAMENLPVARQGKGKLILRAQLSFSQKGEPFALIAFSDTGPGISEEHLTQIFEPFFTTKPEGEGNGLGLYLTRELVLKNQGRITASSFEGSGTTFILEFPLAGHLSNKHLTAC